MEQKKQASIDWLINELTKNGFNFKLYKKEIQQAKDRYDSEINDIAFYFFCKGMDATEEGGKHFFQVYEEFKNNSK
jgi:hypothetical protein